MLDALEGVEAQRDYLEGVLSDEARVTKGGFGDLWIAAQRAYALGRLTPEQVGLGPYAEIPKQARRPVVHLAEIARWEKEAEKLPAYEEAVRRAREEGPTVRGAYFKVIRARMDEMESMASSSFGKARMDREYCRLCALVDLEIARLALENQTEGTSETYMGPSYLDKRDTEIRTAFEHLKRHTVKAEGARHDLAEHYGLSDTQMRRILYSNSRR